MTIQLEEYKERLKAMLECSEANNISVSAMCPLSDEDREFGYGSGHQVDRPGCEVCLEFMGTLNCPCCDLGIEVAVSKARLKLGMEAL